LFKITELVTTKITELVTAKVTELVTADITAAVTARVPALVLPEFAFDVERGGPWVLAFYPLVQPSSIIHWSK
jgi:hypothetical protein